VTTYTYGFDDAESDNQHGDLVGISYNDGSTPSVSRTYDRLGRVHTVARNGITTTLSYNEAGLLTGESYAGGSLAGLSVTRTFTDDLRLETVTGYDGSSPLQGAAYDYDSTGRLWKVTSDTDVVQYGYHDDSDLVETVTFNQGSSSQRLVTSRSFDNLNRLRTISSMPEGSASPTLPLSYTYAYNRANQRTRSTLAAGSFWVYTYDALGQVTSGKRYWADGTPVAGQQFEYGFDEIGNRTTTGGRDSAVSEYTMRDNGLNQYESRTVAGAVDVLGSAHVNASVTVNTVAPTRHGEYFHRVVPVDNTGQYGEEYPTITVAASLGGSQDSQSTKAFVPAETEEFVHDYDGNLRRDGRWVYEWDGENRLVEMRRDYADPSGAQLKLTFEYDWQGRRIRKTVYQGDGQTPPLQWTLQTDTVFLYDGWNLLAELNAGASKAKIRTYVWGADLSGSLQGAGGVGGLLKVVRWTSPTASTDHFVAYDGNGNVMGLVDSTNGAFTARYEYGPFGEPLRATGPEDANHFRFSTKYYDSESGLYYYGYRYYDPLTGRWMSVDPIGESGGLNKFAFALNEPPNTYDGLGLWTARGLMAAYEQRYGDQGVAEILAAMASGIRFRGRECWFHDWWVTGSTINIANKAWFGSERSDKNAAAQLHEALYRHFGIGSRDWSTFFGDLARGGFKMATGVAGVAGSVAFSVGTGGGGTIVAWGVGITSGNTVIEGATQIFGVNGGYGWNPADDLAGQLLGRTGQTAYRVLDIGVSLASGGIAAHKLTHLRKFSIRAKVRDARVSGKTVSTYFLTPTGRTVYEMVPNKDFKLLLVGNSGEVTTTGGDLANEAYERE
jgi:RHS repeat-associated protein